jgi:aldehyde:ferredoxin oxidoreductase
MVEHLRTMGRCGGGAVMGSKKLKAVLFRGRQKMEVAEPDQVKLLIKEMIHLESRHPVTGLSKTAEKNSGGTFRFGTSSFLPIYDELGETPTQNALSNSWGKGAEMYSALKDHITGSEGCLNCVLQCGNQAEVKQGKWTTPTGHYPEYETMVSFGHYILNDNVEAIIHLNHLCNCNGIDTISSGNAIAFAMECYEKGLITRKDLDGLELTWGNIGAARMMLNMIIKREGFGDLLAEGGRIASEEIGKGSVEAAMHVKGLELPGHDIRSKDGGKV